MNQMDRPILPTEIRRIYQGRVFTLQVETIALPKGGVLKADVIRHPGSVVIIPVTDAGEIVLVRQYRPAIGRWAWELPAGSLKPGEDVDRAAIRECHEETGLVPEHLDKLGAFYPTPGYCDELMNIYRATGLRQPREDEHATQDEDEDIEAKAFDLVTVRSMIATGDIIDLKTVAGVALLG
jgi:ADP-ribose pyrophosphatase